MQLSSLIDIGILYRYVLIISKHIFFTMFCLVFILKDISLKNNLPSGTCILTVIQINTHFDGVIVRFSVILQLIDRVNKKKVSLYFDNNWVTNHH